MSKESKRKSRKRELEIAEQVGGKRHTGSGSLWWKKSDASDPTFQYEDKFTEKSYFTISRGILDKIEKEAALEFKIPVLRIGFLGAKKPTEFAMLRKIDCDYLKPCQSIVSDKKSRRLKLDLLHLYYKEADDIVLLLLSLSGKEYFVLTWDDFLDVKDAIFFGGST